jgi:argininosuccinate synthase
VEKIILAYSGGLDTSVSIRWLQETYGYDVVSLTIDLGQERDLETIQQKALGIGAIKALVVDARKTFVEFFVWPSLQAGALYQGVYPLATALGRPLIAKLLVDAAEQEGAVAVAHGCTGKGNDQVRIDLAVGLLAPHLKIVAPMREWKMTRDAEIAYAARHGIPVPATVQAPFIVDLNLWGRSVEAGVLEDPWNEPPEEAYAWTTNPSQAPDEPEQVELEFEEGIPTKLNGERMEDVELIETLNVLAGHHGVGRIDHVEDRVVGIKTREVYEAPAAVVLHTAHRALETLTLSRESLDLGAVISRTYADLIYRGLWYSAVHHDLVAYLGSNQQYVTGTVRVKLFKGSYQVVGRKAPASLYNKEMATYDEGDQFDHSAAVGFIKLYGQAHRTQARVQLLDLLPQSRELLGRATSARSKRAILSEWMLASG